MKTWDELNASVGVTSTTDDETKVKSGWDSLNESARTRVAEKPVSQPMPETSPVKDEGIVDKTLDFGAFLFKKGMDGFNWVIQRNQKAELDLVNKQREMTAEALTRNNPEKAAEYKAQYSPYADYGSLVQDTPLVKAINSPTGKAITTGTSKATSNVTLKGVAALRALGEDSFTESYKRIRDEMIAERVDENRTLTDKVWGGADSIIQSLIGLGAVIATGLATRGNPYAAGTVGSLYFGSLSAASQIEEEGKVTSRGKIATDVVGDMILGNLLTKMFAVAPAASFAKTTASGGAIEGTTEFGQSLIKYAIEYGNATSEEQKAQVIERTKEYFKSGQAVEEFIVGGVGGAIATGAAYKLSQDTAVNKAEIDIKNSFAMDVDRAIEAGDIDRADVYVGEGKTLTPQFAEGRINDVAQKLAMVDEDLSTRYKTLVDVENTTMDEIIATGERVLSEFTSGKRAADINYVPPQEGEREKKPAVTKSFDIAESLGLGDEVNTFRDELANIEDTTSQRAQDLRAFFTDYNQAFYDTTIRIPDPDTNAVFLEVTTVPFPDGKVAVKYSANAPEKAIAVDYDFKTLYETKEAATEAALKAIREWTQFERLQPLSDATRAALLRIFTAAKNPNAAIKSVVDMQKELDERRVQRKREKDMRAKNREKAEQEGQSRIANDVLVKAAFEESSGQVPVGRVGNAGISIGSFGTNNITRKINDGKPDRIPLDKLEETIPNITKVYRAGDTGLRADNLIAVAEMPDGEKRAVVLRRNRFGDEEVINFFRISNENYEKDLEKFGTPDRSRTDIFSLEPSEPIQLADRSTATVPDATAVGKRRRKTDPVNTDNPMYQRVIRDVRNQGGYVSNEEAASVVKSLLGDDFVAVEFARRIVAGKGQDAWGRYWNGVITMVNNPHWSTPYHESVHGYLATFMEKDERQALFAAIRAADGKTYTDVEAEEAIADGFVEYVANRRTFTGKLKQFFDRVVAWVRKTFGLQPATRFPVNNLYETMLSGRRPNRAQYSYVQVGSDRLDILAMYQEAKDFAIKFVNSPLLEGRDKFSYQFLKDSVRSGKFPISGTEQRFMNEVLDANFQGRKDITRDELMTTIDRELLPMSVVESSQWSNYGLDEANVGPDFVGEIQENKTFVVGAGPIVAPFMDYGGRAHGFQNDNPGFMFHFRASTTHENDGVVFNVVEVQSDPFQKDLFLNSATKSVEELFASISVSNLRKIPAQRAKKLERITEKALNGLVPEERIFAVKAAENAYALAEKIALAKEQGTGLEALVADFKAAHDAFEGGTATYSETVEKMTALSEQFRNVPGSVATMFSDYVNNLKSTKAPMGETLVYNVPVTPYLGRNPVGVTFENSYNAVDAMTRAIASFRAAETELLKEYETAVARLEALANGELGDDERRASAAIRRFMEFKDNWYELAVRAIINTAARQGAVAVRMPSAFTVTQVEGWGDQIDGGTGLEQYEIDRADIGDALYVPAYGEEYIVLEKYGDGTFGGTTESPDSSGRVENIEADRRDELESSSWRDYLEDDVSAYLESRREKMVELALDQLNGDIARIEKENTELQSTLEDLKKVDSKPVVISKYGNSTLREDTYRIRYRDILDELAQPSYVYNNDASGLSFGEHTRTLDDGESTGVFVGDRTMLTKDASDWFKENFTGEEYRKLVTGEMFVWAMNYDTSNQSPTYESTTRQKMEGLAKAISPDAKVYFSRYYDGKTDPSEVFETVPYMGYVVLPKVDATNPTVSDILVEGGSELLDAIRNKAKAQEESRTLTRLEANNQVIARRQEHAAKWRSYLEKTPPQPLNNPYWVLEKKYEEETNWTQRFSATELSRAEEEMERQKEIDQSSEYRIVKVTQSDEEWTVATDDIIDDIEWGNYGDEAVIQYAVDEYMKNFDAADELESIYSKVYFDDEKDYYAAYDREPDIITIEAGSDGSAEDNLEEARNRFEEQTDLKNPDPESRFGALSSRLNGAAYRYEVDIPRYMNKYRKDKVEKEVAYGLSWFRYDIDQEVDGKPIPLYQVKKPSDAVTFTTIERIKGRKSVSRQFIADQLNRPDIKLVERQVLLDVLNTFEGDTVSVDDFIRKAELHMMPLTPDVKTPYFKSVHLPDTSLATNYEELVYQSPVKIDTTLLPSHGPLTQDDHYFAHVRRDVVDEEGTKVRRVIEIQSDLLQRDRLENMVKNYGYFLESQMSAAFNVDISYLEYRRKVLKAKEEIHLQAGGKGDTDPDLETVQAELAKVEAEITGYAEKARPYLAAYEKSLKPLKSYRNLWHERVIREEVAGAARDGFARLRFPTGSTAMQIEGLSEPVYRSGLYQAVTAADIFAGELYEIGNTEYVAVEVGMDGQLLAVPTMSISYLADANDMSESEVVEDIVLRGTQSVARNDIESFSLEGVDPENPIYRFYENEVGKYLKKRYQATKVTDAKGNSWWDVVVPVDAANTPVPMYQLEPVGTGETRPSRAYQRVLERLQDATEDDANYNQMSIAKDTAAALAYVNSNPEEASKVALGVLPPPPGVTETAISIAVAEQAAMENNYELQAEVERSRSLRQTRRGQEIVAERGRFNKNSASHFISRVLAARMDHLVSSYPRFPTLKKGAKMSGSAIIDRETAALKKEMKKRLSKVAEAEQFIKNLTC